MVHNSTLSSDDTTAWVIQAFRLPITPLPSGEATPEGGDNQEEADPTREQDDASVAHVP